VRRLICEADLILFYHSESPQKLIKVNKRVTLCTPANWSDTAWCQSGHIACASQQVIVVAEAKGNFDCLVGITSATQLVLLTASNICHQLKLEERKQRLVHTHVTYTASAFRMF